ncbi:GntR family transcriptional regulator [Teichococcus aestuarii]|uniref:GntR family transcriptional regulator n=1 Tax=Teichococcus aestuarii TaxID=568898 RepID=UPI0036119102
MQTLLLSADDLASLATRVYVRLRDAIAEGRLVAGERLSERGLAESFGVSPAPVRDALHRLEAEGLVTTLPRRGSFVADLGPAKLRQMGRLRAALEGVAAGFAAEQATPVQAAALRRHLHAVRDATQAGDLAALAAANDALHAAILAIADHAVLARHLEALRGYDHVTRRRILAAAPEEPRRALREHAGIVSAIRRGDAARAEARMRAHTLRSLSQIVEDTKS